MQSRHAHDLPAIAIDTDHEFVSDADLGILRDVFRMLPNGVTVEHCLAVLEMPVEGGDAYTHYYAPNIGKVAVQGPEGWVYRLLEFRSGGKGHSE